MENRWHHSKWVDYPSFAFATKATKMRKTELSAYSGSVRMPSVEDEQKMTTNQNTPVPVLLRQRMIVADGLVFDAKREVTLPIQPFVGLTLYNTSMQPIGCDLSENAIERVAYDLKTGRVICYLPIDDYRPESSGSDDWTEKDVRERYRAWTLKRDENCKPK
jgi:hypothetical protein